MGEGIHVFSYSCVPYKANHVFLPHGSPLIPLNSRGFPPTWICSNSLVTKLALRVLDPKGAMRKCIQDPYNTKGSFYNYECHPWTQSYLYLGAKGETHLVRAKVPKPYNVLPLVLRTIATRGITGVVQRSPNLPNASWPRDYTTQGPWVVEVDPLQC